MPDKDDAIVEAMARAMCEVYEKNPDDLVFAHWIYDPEKLWLLEDVRLPQWKQYQQLCEAQLAAHRAMLETIDRHQREGINNWLRDAFPDKAEKEIGE